LIQKSRQMFMINVYAFMRLLHAGLRNLSLPDFPPEKVDVSVPLY
jgi:hypothetical protein